MRSYRTVTVVALAFTLVSMTTSAVRASATQASDVLELNSSFSMKYQFGDEYCPPDVRFAQCVRFTGKALVPGLGATTIMYDKVVVSSDPDCQVSQSNLAVVAVAGKGDLQLTRPGKACGRTAPTTVGPLVFDVTGGTGAFSGASGTLRFNSQVHSIDFSCACGRSLDRWAGALTVPGAEFDTTAPSLTPARSRTIRAPRNAKRVAVRFPLTAHDAVDGQVPVVCSPRSGSRFPLGRTTVTCAADDTSGNTARMRFTITVKPSAG